MDEAKKNSLYIVFHGKRNRNFKLKLTDGACYENKKIHNRYNFIGIFSVRWYHV